VAYSSTTPVRVFGRFANHPEDFDGAEFIELQTLHAYPDITDPSHIPFGQSSKYVQIKLQSQESGFELFPPLTMVAAPRVQKD
jgi:hypothetical protein